VAVVGVAHVHIRSEAATRLLQRREALG
jgi:hypothetical protein